MRLTLLAAESQSTAILRNYLLDHGVSDVEIVLEAPVPREETLLHRYRKLGWRSVAGQVLFQLCIPPLLRRLSRGRATEIMRLYGLRDTPLADAGHRVATINAPIVAELLQARQPELVLVHGTRIIKSTILKSVASPFVNIHAGIIPRYRGVHGGYWARWSKDDANFGVTIHLVDPGVDTGAVLRHLRFAPTERDNFVTYPLLQLAEALPKLVELLRSFANDGVFEVQTADAGAAESRQWYHPL
ncbi:formyl transferase [Ancylobacter polymorphus]|uniref:phosphoribosylglycinamide formyltransferase 1 n=1 Tax=Ancylobacter polymorphus TaxID=223390 RepID=A0A9E7A1J3_9HYPH|nr:formyl transferase [Ancylobacter polymorphus]UOK72795.1 formyl transferase [Ancylobacter polymorphus]